MERYDLERVARERRGRASWSGVGRVLAAAVVAGWMLAAPAWAEGTVADQLVEALTQGTPVLNVRGRIELAEADGFNRSEAYTVRTRLGYGTKPFHGLRVYMDFENIAAASLSTYFDPTRPPNIDNNTPIADPPGTEVNQGFLALDRPDWLGLAVIGGRQRIVLDDHRFIGDVGWRQNQQTYDAAYLHTSLALEGLTARYAYIGHVDRIFGGGGGNALLADFGSESHIVNVGFTRFSQAQIAAFAYMLDLTLPYSFPNSANASKSFGMRVNGAIGLTDALKLIYEASYAYQSQYAAKTPDYAAHYALGDLGVAWNVIGTIGAGFELLGSDAGKQQFQTPLATLHKFNGWADVFLDNGGANGLKDFHAYVMPRLPWQLKMRLVYHRFWADEGSAVLGNEFDASLGRSFGKHLDLLFKSAYFVKADGSPRPTTYRIWFDLTIKF